MSLGSSIMVADALLLDRSYCVANKSQRENVSVVQWIERGFPKPLEQRKIKGSSVIVMADSGTKGSESAA
jgi:hypothetical protein